MKGAAWGRAMPLGKTEIPGISLLETENLPLVLLMLLGFLLLKLSAKTGAGLFREKLSPGDTKASVWAGSAKCCDETTGRRGRVGTATATDVVLAAVVWKRVMGPACWMEEAGRRMAGDSPSGNRTVINQTWTQSFDKQHHSKPQHFQVETELFFTNFPSSSCHTPCVLTNGFGSPHIKASFHRNPGVEGSGSWVVSMGLVKLCLVLKRPHNGLECALSSDDLTSLLSWSESNL